MMEGLSFVTGATGHLGNSLVRRLLAKGKKVRAGVRNLNCREPLEGLNCETVYADLLDKDSLGKALDGVEILYQVAAVFKHWSPNPDREIVQANLTMTHNILEAAAEQGVKKVVYVSSIVALNRNVVPLNESTWNRNFRNPYFHAKTVAEESARQLARELNLPLVTVLPSAIIGSNAFSHLTPTMSFLKSILDNKLPFNPGFNFNYVDVTDVAEGMVAVAEKGRNGERYILATEPAITTGQVIEIAQSLFPNIKTPPEIAYDKLMDIAIQAELQSQSTGEPPFLLRSLIETSYHADIRIDIAKAKRELEYEPMPPEEAIKKTLLYLSER